MVEHVLLDPLIGRGLELAAVEVALAESRLVSITGLGGTGKTRLALAVGERAGIGRIGLRPGEPALGKVLRPERVDHHDRYALAMEVAGEGHPVMARRLEGDELDRLGSGGQPGVEGREPGPALGYAQDRPIGSRLTGTTAPDRVALAPDIDSDRGHRWTPFRPMGLPVSIVRASADRPITGPCRRIPITARGRRTGAGLSAQRSSAGQRDAGLPRGRCPSSTRSYVYQRDKPKDAYDIDYVLRHAGVDEIAAGIAEFNLVEPVRTALGVLAAKFAGVDGIGATSVALYRRAQLRSTEADELQALAFARVQRLLDLLRQGAR